MLRNAPIEELLAEARGNFASKRPATFQAHQEACKHLPGGNTRTVLYHGPFPIRVVKGEGSYIEDMDGFSYLNLLGEYSAGVFGHSHPQIREAVTTALGGGVNLGAHNTLEPQLAALVSNRFPAIQKVRFTNSGTEANLMAIATARAVTGRDKVLVFKGGYHGALLYFGVSGSPVNAPFPYVVADYNDIEGSRQVIRKHRDEIACAIVEPMQGSAGCIPGDLEFLSALREETEKAGILLIFDEVMTSRFGRNGAHSMLGLEPDLLTLGKWVGGGMSFGAFGGKAGIMDCYDPGKPDALPHAGTFNNNVISMSAGIAALTSAFSPDIAEALHARGDDLRDRLNDLFSEHGVLLQATGMGALLNIHPVRGNIKNVDDLKDVNSDIRELLFLDLLEHGYYIASRGFVSLSTSVSDIDIANFIEALAEIVSARKPVLTLKN